MPFFEGWYHRLSLPDRGVSLAEQDRSPGPASWAFMYAIQNPQPGQPHCGGAAQVLLPSEQVFCRSFPDPGRFCARPEPPPWARAGWGAPSRLWVAHDRPAAPAARPLEREFYELSATHHRGTLWEGSTGQLLRWDYAIEPVEGWGAPVSQGTAAQRATGGPVADLPWFDPGWQVLSARGRATGWLAWGDRRWDFAAAPTYAEKNWGQSFPSRWFWLQAQQFVDGLSGADLDESVSVTAAGGDRTTLLGPPRRQSLGLIGLHWQGKFYEFWSANADLAWWVEPWGRWQMWARLRAIDRHSAQVRAVAGALGLPLGDPPLDPEGWQLELSAHTEATGAALRGPSAAGFGVASRQTLRGQLTLRLRQGDRLCLVAHSARAALETGGGPWDCPWQHPAGRSQTRNC